jgi:hypothetical protein
MMPPAGRRDSAGDELLPDVCELPVEFRSRALRGGRATRPPHACRLLARQALDVDGEGGRAAVAGAVDGVHVTVVSPISNGVAG